MATMSDKKKYEVMAKLLSTEVEPATDEHGDMIGFHILIEGRQIGVAVAQDTGVMKAKHALLALQAALTWAAEAFDADIGGSRKATPDEIKKFHKDMN